MIGLGERTGPGSSKPKAPGIGCPIFPTPREFTSLPGLPGTLQAREHIQKVGRTGKGKQPTEHI